MEERFEVVDRQKFGVASGVEIIRDKLTGVMYLYRHDGYSGGLTVLVDKDGKPLTKLD